MTDNDLPGYVPPEPYRPDAPMTARTALAEAIYCTSRRHDWEHTVDRTDRTAKILDHLP